MHVHLVWAGEQISQSTSLQKYSPDRKHSANYTKEHVKLHKIKRATIVLKGCFTLTSTRMIYLSPLFWGSRKPSSNRLFGSDLIPRQALTHPDFPAVVEKITLLSRPTIFCFVSTLTSQLLTLLFISCFLTVSCVARERRSQSVFKLFLN